MRVEARYGTGSVVRDVVSGGYAFFPLNNDQRITAITLFTPGTKADRGTVLPVSLDRPSVQLVNADLGAMVQSPFQQMILTIKGDRSLAPEEMIPRGVYRKPLLVPPAPPSIPADPPEDCAAGTSADAETAQSLSAAWQEQVTRQFSFAQQYPPEAMHEEIEGTVYLRLRAEHDGKLTQIAIERSSGHAVLDEAALRAAWLVQPLPRIPCSVPSKAEFILPIRFRIAQ